MAPSARCQDIERESLLCDSDTAPTIHGGFPGHIVLEMYNFGNYPLRLRPGKLAICQLIFERLGQIPRDEVRTGFKDQKKIR